MAMTETNYKDSISFRYPNKLNNAVIELCGTCFDEKRLSVKKPEKSYDAKSL